MDPAELAPAQSASGRWSRSLSLLLLCLFFAGLYTSTIGSNGMLGWDESEYASLGRSVLRGEGFSISGEPDRLRPPVLPLSAAASMAVTGGRGDVSARLPILFFSVLALLVVYEAMRRERDHLTGWVAAAFLGLMPAFWQFTAVLMTEIPFIAFFTAAIVSFYFGLYRSPRFFYLSWIATALAMLTRYTAVLFAPIAICFTLFALVTDPDARTRIAGRHFWSSPFVGLALLIPWLVRQQLVFGDALVGFKAASGQLAAFLPEVSMPWYFYPTHIPEIVSPLLSMALVVGIVWAVSARDHFAFHCLFVVAFILVWFSFYRFKEIRMAVATLPFLAMIAALGVTRATLPQPLDRRWTAGLAAFVIVALGASYESTRLLFSGTVTLGYPSLTEAMKDLRARSAADDVVMGASVPQIFWYADRIVHEFPAQANLVDSLAECDWVVVTNYERGQKPYAWALVSGVTQPDLERGDAAVFESGGFATVLIRASLLRERLLPPTGGSVSP